MQFLAALLSLLAAAPPSARPDYDALKRQAEGRYAEKSFRQAHALYEQASPLAPAAERSWVDMRLADTAWRAESASESADTTISDRARAALEELIRKAGEEHDRVWAEANESLGDYWADHRNIAAETPYYVAALDWWAGSQDLPAARSRYLGMVWRFAMRGDDDEDDEDVQRLPRQVLVNAVSIADTPEDRAHARYLLALRLLQEGQAESAERALELLDEIIALGKTTPWYDDALYTAATQISENGSVVLTENAAERKPDYVKALTLLRRLITEFREGETKYYHDAKEKMDEIEKPSVEVAAETLVPDSEQQFILNWRNVGDVELTITPVDLTADAAPTRDSGLDVRIEGKKPMRRWTHHTGDTGQHVPDFSRIRIEPKLPIGAYAITARAGAAGSTELLLVTDLAIITNILSPDFHIYVANALTGEPVAGAQVKLWQQRDQEYVPRTARTDANGLVTLPFVERSGGTAYVTAVAGARQAFDSTYTYWRYRQPGAWRIYAFTDRPAYRPDETVHWKIIARRRDESRWRVPQGTPLTYEVFSPRGEVISTGEAKLSPFGSFWADVPLTTAMPLGAYGIRFSTGTGKDRVYVGNASLFRLEEFKLPEFRVAVKTPEENDKPKLYRLGDTIEATIEATYYFGGPVANASVEAVVHQESFVHGWYPWRDEYPWLWDVRPDYRGGGTIVKRETLKTDANGRATLSIETPRDNGDIEYTIEARVIDASRREVTGEGEVRVMKQRYTVSAWPAHYIHRPNEKVEVRFHAADANDQPVRTTGSVTITRRTWRTADYAQEEVEKTSASTDAAGDASVTFTPKREGYYVVAWSSEDRDPKRPAAARDLVQTETAVFVARDATLDLGYHTDGLEIILDKETFRAGSSAPVMLVTPASGRWVLLTTYGDEVLDTQVIHLDGTVKVVQLPIDEQHTPNFFIAAASLFDRELSTDSKRVVVPPLQNYLTVDVKTDREEYEPRQEGAVTVTTRDASGNPVPAEVALAVSDESVTAIATDPAGDPRRFFGDEPRYQLLQTSSSVTSQHYMRLVFNKKGLLVDDRQRDIEDAEGVEGGVEGSVVGGVAGGVVGGVIGGVVAESITTTASAPKPVTLPPPPPPAPMLRRMAKTAGFLDELKDGDVAHAAGEPAVVVRSDFRSTALWKPNVITDENGLARATLKYPEALTTWRTTARAATAGSQFGMATATARTKMPLIVRLQAPRFFVAGDRTVVSAVINNNTGEEARVTPELVAEGVVVRGRADGGAGAVVVPAGGEARVDWNVVAESAGPAKLRVSGRSATHGDAMEKPFTVYEHGIDKLLARSGKLRGDEALVRLELPRERRDTDLTVQVAPSLAVTMLDALPYLIDYPYGCTEQTMSRFLPAAIVARTLTKNGLDPGDIEGHLFGGIEPEHAAATHPKGSHDLHLLDDMAAKSMTRLYDFQHGDGGWGWWKEGDSDAFMTAYVVWGFAVARDGGLPVKKDAVERAVSWLDRKLVESEGHGHDQAWMLHALGAWRHAAPNELERKALDDVYVHRDRLTAYSRALLALAAHDFGDAERAAVLVRNLEDGVKVDRAPDQSVVVRGSGSGAAEVMATAHWGEDRFWWRWYEGPVETTSFALQALVTIDPKNALIEPVMNWLVKNRRGAQWNNTRDTAIAILALNDYLQTSGELQGDAAYEVSVNGQVIAARTVTAAQMLAAPSRFPVGAAAVRDGVNEIRIRRTGGGARPLYFAAEARFISLEEPVKAAGNELFVRRDYLRLAPHPTLLKGVVYEGVPLRDGGTIESGERADVILTIETKNDYDYLMFEDLKPAGLEAVALQSGTPLYAVELRRDSTPNEPRTTGRTAWVYQELRDRKVAMFIDHLPQGIWEIRYPLRAEVPGAFHALPLLGQAMYVPEIRANGEEVRLTVR